MGVVDAGVDDGHDDRGPALENRPGLRRVDVGVRGALEQAESPPKARRCSRTPGRCCRAPTARRSGVARNDGPASCAAGSGCCGCSSVRRRGRSGCAVARDRGLFVLGLDPNAMDTVRAISATGDPPAALCAAAFALALAPGLNFTRISPSTNGPPLIDCAEEPTVSATATKMSAMSALLGRTGNPPASPTFAAGGAATAQLAIVRPDGMDWRSTGHEGRLH